ncbi:DNA sulfur modification protein DndB [Paludibacterium sp.]|uniref:DNA sulfur modification protein DndB n=1 Tax=Paludibacterium sp. TaxID=1917523 RepID=UPI0025F28C2D|nr:DNA sulfur modification protein DndB [Paludibacterium sp.]MBV8647860.1 hypothetical protein [Paludibacterium sp.]
MKAKPLYRPLREIGKTADSTERPYKVFYNVNMGNTTFLITLPLFDFYRMSAIANEQIPNIAATDIAQRPIDMDHANRLANYVLKGLIYSVITKRESDGRAVPSAYTKIQRLIGHQPYIALQPLVCNLRNCARDGADLRARALNVFNVSETQEIAAYEILLSQKHILWVIDGQHRRKALEIVFDFIDHALSTHAYPIKKTVFPLSGEQVKSDELQLWSECNEIARSECKIAAEVHLGLKPPEERQLFHDLNNLGKKVETSLALEFDRGNPVNVFVQDRLIKEILNWPVVDRDIINWHEDDGSITRKDLVSISTRLIINKTNPKGATPAIVDPRLDKAIDFWHAVQRIPHIGRKGAKTKTVAAQPVVLKALAKIAFDLCFGRERKLNLSQKFFRDIPKIDFSHENRMWGYYRLTKVERSKAGLKGLEEYLPDDSREGIDFNRDIGDYDAAKMMRFGAKHNDIYPIIGDMVRWQLGLPNRNER